MKRFSALVLVLFLALLLVWGCSSTPEEDQVSSTEVIVEKTETPQPEPVPEPVEEPVEIPVIEEPEEPLEETFVVTEEIFTKTFEDVEELIKKLNTIIDKENYDKWTENLTADYQSHYSSADVLKEISERPILKKYNLRLTTMKDYFRYVVVPSRANARLDDLVFEDNNHVKAIMIIDGQRAILYQLELVADEWKIGI
jgi:hypothetical protein